MHSGTLNTFRIFEQVSERNGVVPPLPVHTDHPEESGGRLGCIVKQRANRNSYRHFRPIRLVQYGRHRSFEFVRQGTSHLYPSSTARSRGATIRSC